MSLLPGLRNLFRKAAVERELDDELRAYVDALVERGMAAGQTRAQATRAARLEMGSVAALKDRVRDVGWETRVEILRQDFRYAARTLWRSPGLAAAIVISIALGIGANAAIFSVLNSVVLRSLPVPEPDRLVQLAPGGGREGWTNPLWEQLRDRQDVLAGVFAWSPMNATFDLSGGGESDPANGLWVSGSFFEVLGVHAVAGRMFNALDDQPRAGAAGQVAVISYRCWQRRFAGQADVVGRTITIDRVPFTIIGVAPPVFLGPNIGAAFDVALPISAQPVVLRRDRLAERNWWWLSVMGRLEPGQSTASAAAGLARLQPDMRENTRPLNLRPEEVAAYLDTPIAVKLSPAGPSAFRETYQQPIIVLMGVVGLVLLIACVNVANLLLARAERRRYDVSLRLALGASRARLLRQALIESLLLSACGGSAGLALAMLAGRWLSGRLPVNAALDLSVDWHVVAFTSALSICVALVFGIGPALHATGIAPVKVLAGRRAATTGQSRLGLLLVSAQVAFCLMLLVTAGLFIRTMVSLSRQDDGVDRDRVLVAAVDARRSAVPSGDRLALYNRLLEAARRVPGVSDAAFSAVTPVSNNEWDTVIENPVGQVFSSADRRVLKNEVSPRWFATYGIPLIAGRDFVPSDQVRQTAVVIINESFARRYLPNRQAMGETLRESGSTTDMAPAMTVVGIAGNSIYASLRDAAPPTMYVPSAFGFGPLSIRSETARPSAIVNAVTMALADVDRDLSLSIRPFAADIAASVSRERLVAWLAGAFGGLALLLAGVGLFGVVSYSVAARRREIGIRLALGASQPGVVGLVARRVGVMVGSGLVAGIVLSLWSSRFFASLLFHVGPADVPTYVAATLMLVSVAVAAVWGPTRRAASIDPATTLRAE